MKKLFKNEYLKYPLGIFLFTFIIFLMTPLAGDDWGNYVVGSNGIKSCINNAVSMYYLWEGRFMSRIFLNFFTYHKLLWALLNAIQITTIISCSYKIINVKNKIIYILPILGMLLVNYNFYSQNYLWLAGNMTYLTPTFLTMIIFTYLFKQKDYHIKPFIFILFSILSIIIPMYVENIGCAYVFGLLLWIIYVCFKEKRLSLQLVFMLVLSAISLTIMLLSPGSKIRMDSSMDFYNLNIFEKIFTNIPNFIHYVLNKNIFILISMLIPINIYINRKLNLKYKKLIIALFNIVPLLSIIQNIIYMIPLDIINKIHIYDGFLVTSNWYFIIYWILFSVLFLFSIYELIKNKDEAIKTLIITFSAVSSCLVMLLTPTWGDRVTVLCTLTLLFVSIKLISESIIIKEKYNKLIKILLILVIIYYSIMSCFNFIFQLRRAEQIKQITNNHEGKIYLYHNRNELLWNYHPWNEYHEKTFKIYYNIDNNVEIEIVTPTKKELYKFILYGEYIRNQPIVNL